MNPSVEFNQWMAVSSLQKSIRRGLIEPALMAWQSLEQHQRAYGLYRLSIIATEDLGTPSLSFSSPFLSTELKKINTQSLDCAYFETLVTSWCTAVKDRTACDAVSHLCHISLTPQHRWIEEWEEDYLNPQLSWEVRLRAAWEILGTRLCSHPTINALGVKGLGEHPQQKYHRLDRFIELQLRAGVSDSTAQSMKHALTFQREGHAMALGLLELLYKTPHEEVSSSLPSNANPLVHEQSMDAVYYGQTPYLLCAVDGHTQEGKKALSQWLAHSSSQDWRHWMHQQSIDRAYWIDFMKSVLFRAHGQRVNRRFVHPMATSILKVSQEEHLRYKAHQSELSFQETMQQWRVSSPSFFQFLQTTALEPTPFKTNTKTPR